MTPSTALDAAERLPIGPHGLELARRVAACLELAGAAPGVAAGYGLTIGKHAEVYRAAALQSPVEAEPERQAMRRMLTECRALPKDATQALGPDGVDLHIARLMRPTPAANPAGASTEGPTPPAGGSGAHDHRGEGGKESPRATGQGPYAGRIFCEAKLTFLGARNG